VPISGSPGSSEFEVPERHLPHFVLRLGIAVVYFALACGDGPMVPKRKYLSCVRQPYRIRGIQRSLGDDPASGTAEGFVQGVSGGSDW
jgi:hypothetical protein